MPDVMMFPDTVEEFMESYKMVDVEHVYSNGVEFVPIYRMMQWFQHRPERKTSEWLHEYLQTAVDFGIITETQASRLMDMIDDSEDNT